ncbi:hypothetical protein [Bradyrhizobium sp. USDA 3650]
MGAVPITTSAAGLGANEVVDVTMVPPHARESGTGISRRVEDLRSALTGVAAGVTAHTFVESAQLACRY